MPLVIMPFLDRWDLTQEAAADVLRLSGSPDLLLVNNGSTPKTRVEAVEWQRWIRLQGGVGNRVQCWHFNLPLPLAAVWNTALRYAWERGELEALVVNNDVRLWAGTYTALSACRAATDALFVTGVGVTAAQYTAFLQHPQLPEDVRGGPDFSCFLIAKSCHARYQFDERFRPAYFEDNDYHRRVILGGEGDRIFGVNLPFHHVGSATLDRAPEARAAFAPKFERNRAYYVEKWGGLPGSETFTTPFNAAVEATE
jgi:hypothetical protein